MLRLYLRQKPNEYVCVSNSKLTIYRVWIHSETRTWHDKNIQTISKFDNVTWHELNCWTRYYVYLHFFLLIIIIWRDTALHYSECQMIESGQGELELIWMVYAIKIYWVGNVLNLRAQSWKELWKNKGEYQKSKFVIIFHFSTSRKYFLIHRNFSSFFFRETSNWLLLT